MSTLLERAKLVAKYKRMSLAQLQENIGLSVGHFYNIKYLSRKVIRLFEENYPEINTEWLANGKGEMLNTNSTTILATETKTYKVPLLPIAAQGGTPDNFECQVSKHDCEIIMSPIENIDLAISITGDSMSPEYPSGSKVMVQKINEKAFIEWGCTYVLDTVNGAIIKNVYQCKDDESKIICRSVNPNFTDFIVDISDIRGWYRVRCCITIK